MAARRRRESRHQTAAPDTASTGASSFRLSADQEAAVLETRRNVIKHLPEYRNRIEETIDYFEKHMCVQLNSGNESRSISLLLQSRTGLSLRSLD